jgi:hypothetical protein
MLRLAPKCRTKRREWPSIRALFSFVVQWLGNDGQSTSEGSIAQVQHKSWSIMQQAEYLVILLG